MNISVVKNNKKSREPKAFSWIKRRQRTLSTQSPMHTNNICQNCKLLKAKNIYQQFFTVYPMRKAIEVDLESNGTKLWIFERPHEVILIKYYQEKATILSFLIRSLPFKSIVINLHNNIILIRQMKAGKYKDQTTQEIRIAMDKIEDIGTPEIIIVLNNQIISGTIIVSLLIQDSDLRDKIPQSNNQRIYKYRYQYRLQQLFLQQIKAPSSSSKQQVQNFFQQFKYQLKFEKFPLIIVTANYQTYTLQANEVEFLNPRKLIYEAILAFQVIQMIKQAKTSQIWCIRRMILNQIDKKWKDQNNDQIQAAKKTFISMFSIQSEDKLNLDEGIYNLKLYEDAKSSGKCIFHPTKTTVQIFNQIKTNLNIKNRKKKYIYIVDKAGIGKSISLILFVTLHNFIQKYNLNRNILKDFLIQEKQVQKITQLSKLTFIQKYFYLTVNNQSDSQFQRIIKSQLPFDFKIKQYSSLYQMLQQIQFYYYKNSINIMFIFDQMQNYLKIKQSKLNNPSNQIQSQRKFNRILYFEQKTLTFVSSIPYETIKDQSQINNIDFPFQKDDVQIKKLSERSNLKIKIIQMLTILLFQFAKKNNLSDQKEDIFSFFSNNSDYFQSKFNNQSEILERLTYKSIKLYVNSAFCQQMHTLFNGQSQKQESIEKIIRSIIQFIDDRSQDRYKILQRNKQYQLQLNQIKPPLYFRCQYSYILSKAIIAYKTISWIRSHQNIQTQFQDEIINKIKDLWPKNQEYWLQFLKLTFIGFFSFDLGIKYPINDNIFRQLRFKEAMLNQRLVFHPTKTTQQIFNLIKKQQGNICIHGQGGIGKSISIGLFIILSQSIALLNETVTKQTLMQQTNDEINKKVLQQLVRHPKLFYYSMIRGNNVISFIQVISCQFPIKLQEKKQDEHEIEKVDRLLRDIRLYYRKLNIEVVYVIDQFNIHYSLIRQYYQRKASGEISAEIQFLKRSIRNFSGVLTQLDKNKVIYNCSETILADITAANKTADINDGFFDISKKLRTKIIKIQHESNAHTQNGLLDTINIIKFQMKKHLLSRKNNMMQKVEKVLSNFSILRQIQINYEQKFAFLAELTHKNIKQFFIKYEANYFGYQQEKQQLLNSFSKLFKSIHDFTIQQQSKKYAKFIQIGDQRASKFVFILLVRRKARQAIQNDSNNRNQFTFQLDVTKQESALIFCKQRASIFNVGKRLMMTIYYSPETFLDITNFIWHNYPLINKILINELIEMNADSREWVGITLVNSLTFILSRCELYLKLSQSQNIYICNNYQEKYFYFTAFTNLSSYDMEKCPIIHKDTSIFLRFNSLFKQLQLINQNQSFYISAIPSAVQKDRTKLDFYYSRNRQVIDFLLIKRDAKKNAQKDTYNLKTFDFCVSFSQSEIQIKIKKAKAFFTNFKTVIDYENDAKLEGMHQVNKLIKQIYSQKDLQQMKNHYEFSMIQHCIIAPSWTIQQLNLKSKLVQVKQIGFTVNFIAFQQLKLDIKNGEEISQKQKIINYITLKDSVLKQIKRITQKKRQIMLQIE